MHNFYRENKKIDSYERNDLNYSIKNLIHPLIIQY
jgi:hypothetical protein